MSNEDIDPENLNKFNLPENILTQLFEFSGFTDGDSGFILTYVNQDGTPSIVTKTNSPVVEYNQKCQNNRANNWYDISGIIGSAFNSNTDPSNAPSSVPANNVTLNSVTSKVDVMMNKSNTQAANNNVLENFY